ncbi:GBF-interacting protein 1-like isoform X2 [Euphorbia lathyris]|uniref:GBF-interacting protein 1-like isoform X2 n=1 Tax=Euphorbia lathyris TaxID=212925 RepID=UPI0033141DF8
MSRTSGGGGKGGGGGAARVKIPESVRQTILSIREITGKQHTDEDIYSVLQDCSMDPNDTTQKLLYLDTFHEVKRKRDKKKEKETSSTLSRGARSGRGNHSAKHVYADGAGMRNAIHQRENGVYQKTDRGSSTSLPVKEKVKSDATAPETKASTVTPNGPSTLINGSSPGCVPHSPAGKDVNVIHDISDDDVKKISSLSLLPSSAPDQMPESVVQTQQGNPTSPAIPASLSGVYSSASDPVLPPSIARNPGAVGAIKREVRSQPSAVEQNPMLGNKHIPPIIESELPKNEKTASTIIYPVKEKTTKLKAAEINDLSETPKQSLPSHDSLLAIVPASSVDDMPSSKESDAPLKVVSSEDAQIEKTSILLPEQTIANGHVIFPDHFKVPEAVKSGLTFGSFDSISGPGTKCGSDNGCEVNSANAVGSSHENDETAREPSSSDQSITSTVVDHPDQLESSQVFDKLPKPESEAAPTSDSKFDKAAQEIMLITEGHQNPTIQIAPNYGYGIMPMQAGHFVQFEGHEIQARDVSRVSGFVNENPTTSSSPNPSPSPTPPVQNPVAASPQPILFRPPYPPNYFPYGHYYNPYFLPPMHQFLTHNGLPQQPSAGNAYLGPTAAAPGMKFPVPQYKPGTSTGNPTPIGIQSLYGSYGGSPIGFNPGPPVTSGNSASNEDLSASQLKESQIYATGPLNDVSAWISAPGQDVSSLHLNSLYHVTPQGQHLAFSPAQPGHGPYPGIYAPVQTIAAPSTVNPHHQQTQGMSAAVETVGHPAGAYQQTQIAQMNWNASY